MGRPRQPVEVLIANGKKHLTKTEIEQRKATEVKADKPVRIKAPAWLSANLKKSFRTYAKMLIDLNIYSELDADVLGRYLTSQAAWVQAEIYAAQALADGDPEGASQWGAVQDRYYKQATAAARELGLTISSRCRLVVPETVREQEDDDDGLFG